MKKTASLDKLLAPKPENKNNTIFARMKDEDIAFLDLLAKEYKLNRSEIIRRFLEDRISQIKEERN